MSIQPTREPPRGAGPTVRPREVAPQEVYLDRGPAIPSGYGRDRLVVLMRDPTTIHCYWRLEGEQARPPAGADPKPIVRLVDAATGAARELNVPAGARCAYVEVEPGGRYRVELGYRDAQGVFGGVLATGEVSTPPAGPSAVIDPAWTADPAEFTLLLALLDPTGMGQYEGRAS